jgi:hypothetical protein
VYAVLWLWLMIAAVITCLAEEQPRHFFSGHDRLLEQEISLRHPPLNTRLLSPSGTLVISMSSSNRISRLLISSHCRQQASPRPVLHPTSCRRISQFTFCHGNWSSQSRNNASSHFRRSKEPSSSLNHQLRGRRKFSQSPIASHGHIAKPKPGEE